MKKIILTFCLITVSLVSFGQIPSIGIKGGVNFATTVSTDNGSDLTTGSLTTFNAGVFVDIKFGNISLQPGLNYFGEGQSYTLITEVPEGSNFEETRDIPAKDQVYYVQLPVNFVYHIPILIGNIYLGAGPYVAEGLSGKTTYASEFYNSQKITFGNNDNNDLKPTQFGADAIVGLKLKGSVLIEANYNFGISNDLPSTDTGNSRKSRVFSVSLGYAFL